MPIVQVGSQLIICRRRLILAAPRRVGVPRTGGCREWHVFQVFIVGRTWEDPPKWYLWKQSFGMCRSCFFTEWYHIWHHMEVSSNRGTPPNHPCIEGFFHCKPSGTIRYWVPPFMENPHMIPRLLRRSALGCSKDDVWKAADMTRCPKSWWGRAPNHPYLIGYSLHFITISI